jgi:hypothetical protein
MIVISVRALIRIILCSVVLTALATVSLLGSTGTPSTDKQPDRPTEPVVEAGR